MCIFYWCVSSTTEERSWCFVSRDLGFDPQLAVVSVNSLILLVIALIFTRNVSFSPNTVASSSHRRFPSDMASLNNQGTNIKLLYLLYNQNIICFFHYVSVNTLRNHWILFVFSILSSYYNNYYCTITPIILLYSLCYT